MKKQFLIVTAPVTNLRKEPIEASFEYAHDDLQTTQLLCNEILLCREERGEWCNVEAIEQKKAASGDSWSGYPGWVQKEFVMFLDVLPEFNAVVKKRQTLITEGPDGESACLFPVPMGTRLMTEEAGSNGYYKTVFSDGREGWVSKKEVNTIKPITDVRQLRQNIVDTARLFLNMPYLWGGRSAYMAMNRAKVVTGVDCSGFTNLVCRVHNLDIPRDACDQWRASMHISCDTLGAADLIFVSAEGVHDTIIHVMLYMGGEEFIEASDTGNLVIVNTFEKKFGMRLCDIATKGCIVDRKKILFASMLRIPDKT